MKEARITQFLLIFFLPILNAWILENLLKKHLVIRTVLYERRADLGELETLLQRKLNVVELVCPVLLGNKLSDLDILR